MLSEGLQVSEVVANAGMRNQGIACTPSKPQNIQNDSWDWWWAVEVGTSAKAQVKLQHIKLIIDMYLLSRIDGRGENQLLMIELTLSNSENISTLYRI